MMETLQRPRAWEVVGAPISAVYGGVALLKVMNEGASLFTFPSRTSDRRGKMTMATNVTPDGLEVR